jgi:hypothetical protein
VLLSWADSLAIQMLSELEAARARLSGGQRRLDRNGTGPIPEPG